MVIKDLWSVDKGGLFRGSFHEANKDRINYITNLWDKWLKIIKEDPGLLDELNPTKMSISFDLAPVWNSGKNLCCIDIDEMDVVEQWNVSLFEKCPRSYGSQGNKIFFFSDEGSKQHIISGTPDCKDHIIDIYLSTPRLAFVYGEHPKSTKENPIYYKLDSTVDIPFIKHTDLWQFVESFVSENNLYINTSVKKKREIPEKIVNKLGKSKPKLSDFINLRISDVLGSTDDKIKHPVHGSTHDSNVSLNHQDDTWYCHRCESGGGVLEMIGVIEGIIDCSDSSNQSFYFNQTSTWNDTKLQNWLKLKKVLEDKYGVDVFKYDIGIRTWHIHNKKGFGDIRG